jgi:succinate dehydrogenase / fumarate reductase cytochrome b subunit
MRLTGLFLLVYFVGHVYETSNLVGGVNAWNSMLELTQTTWGHIFLILVIGTSTFHSINGIRLIFAETARGLGKQEDQIIHTKQFHSIIFRGLVFG